MLCPQPSLINFNLETWNTPTRLRGRYTVQRAFFYSSPRGLLPALPPRSMALGTLPRCPKRSFDDSFPCVGGVKCLVRSPRSRYQTNHLWRRQVGHELKVRKRDILPASSHRMASTSTERNVLRCYVTGRIFPCNTCRTL